MTINQTDFVTPLTGNIVIVNNSAFLPILSNADLNVNLEGPERFRLILKTRASSNGIIQASPTITLNDVSFREIYTLTNTGDNAILENSNVLFEVNTINVSNANILYYYTTGNVSNSSFVTGNTGSFFLNSNGYANIRLTTNDVPTNTSVQFNLVISKQPLGTAVATSNTIDVVDINISYIQATGGTIITGGGFRTHVFTTSDNFVITQLGVPVHRTIDYLVVAGGGSGGSPSPATAASGGGAGGLLNGTFTLTPTNIGPRTVTVGGGSTVNPPGSAVQGTPSVLGNPGNPLFITATGGGGGANQQGGSKNGGSGGGGSWNPVSPGVSVAGTGTPGQGNPGGTGYRSDPAGNGAGGGGAGAAGRGQTPGPASGGGNGAPVTWIPSSYGVAGPAPGRWFAGGGGGVGPGGGLASNGTAGGGSANTGGGGQARSNGGSGIVAIRYPYT